ncbi:MAG: glutathione S-transferase N-terminal domain-containing protein [Janthinobacterium lividum]
MKLYHSPTSPFVRKVMACAIMHGLDGQIALVPTNAHASPDELVADNPLSRVPCLVTDDGFALYDSPVICEYLDEISQDIPMLPPKGALRWRALKLQALGDGMMDAAVGRLLESRKPADAARETFIARQKGIVARCLDNLEADVPSAHPDLGTLTIACALGYLDLRFAGDAWRDGHPKLAAWFERISELPALARTAPPPA